MALISPGAIAGCLNGLGQLGIGGAQRTRFCGRFQCLGKFGARVEESNWGWGANAIEFFAVGTAVAPMGDGPVRQPMGNVQQVVTFDNAGG